ncbi:MAG: fatty acid desaturase [Alphaproteobacteria bacterium]|nr:fatty acid desaturase [Alphaproteobacteria bacterium]MCB9974760.1 fatty acid desaturase [Rhodospirillales bacterium]
MTLLSNATASSLPENKAVVSSASSIERHCRQYSGASDWRSLLQLTLTLILFLATFSLAYFVMPYSYAASWPFIVIAAGLLTKLFIIQHDCGHGSFFVSKTGNTWLGRALSLLTATPYDFWRRAHNVHHASSGDLDRRSIGGIDTITVREYKALTKRMQLAYRIYRNPVILIFLGTPFYTIFAQRIPVNVPMHFYDNYKTLSAESIYASIMMTNVALFLFYCALGYVLGFWTLVMLCLPILVLTTWIGGWLFYVQHQFEDAYWQHHEDWSAKESALMGSSYYKLPKILQWFTGSIGLHHIHHLCPGIPNYKLQECMDARPELAEINRLSFLDSLKCLHLKLWDEDRQKLVRFGDL